MAATHIVLSCLGAAAAANLGFQVVNEEANGKMVLWLLLVISLF